MSKNILMPALSPTMEEGNLVKWLKLEGEKINDGEVIAEIETDKATMEVEATDDGTLAKILIPEGTEHVKVNTPIGVLIQEGETYSPQSDAKQPDTEAKSSSNCNTPKETPHKELPKEQPVSCNCNNNSRIFATPLAKRIAAQSGVKISDVQGSGPHGRIIKADIETFLTHTPTKTPTHTKASIQRDAFGLPSYDLIKVSNMRKTIAKRLVECKQTAPHFYASIDCEIDELTNARKSINASEGQKLTINDFIIKAVAQTLARVPKANAAWFEDGIHQFNTSDVSVAVAVDNGLITPVIKSAEHKGLSEISNEMKTLATKAKEGKLKPEEFQGGTFTISNLGMFGVSNFMAIINPPQGCILAVGAGIQKPIVKNGTITIATVMTCTLSVDHRVVDGAIAAEFLAEFKKNIENPTRMLL